MNWLQMTTGLHYNSLYLIILLDHETGTITRSPCASKFCKQHYWDAHFQLSSQGCGKGHRGVRNLTESSSKVAKTTQVLAPHKSRHLSASGIGLIILGERYPFTPHNKRVSSPQPPPNDIPKFCLVEGLYRSSMYTWATKRLNIHVSIKR